MEEPKLLNDALGVVKVQMVQMKRCLDGDQIMEALKAASTMLAELRTSSLTPKQYYELYMSVFDALRHLTTYLYDAHTSGKHHLADLYELVQYAGEPMAASVCLRSLVSSSLQRPSCGGPRRPRLYLMITVGSVYMSIPEAPVKEIMQDLMEMTRGVQHPTRGLFLRHYLSGQTRDYLPVGNSQGPGGNLQDSIAFVLTNFIEMNKLWVRLQHSGHSREREKRELERKELRILVGTNLVRLSQLDGVDLDMYERIILPSVLEQVVNCRDVIAQEYLMEVVIQVFTDDFHLHTLGPFLSATAQLHPKVNIKQIVIALIDRLAAYAAREAENENPEDRKKGEEEAAKRLAERVKGARKGKSSISSAPSPSKQTPEAAAWAKASPPPAAPPAQSPAESTNGETKPTPGPSESATTAGEPSTSDAVEKSAQKEPPTIKKFRGIPENVRLFEVFWHQVVELIKARPDLPIQDISALLVSLINLSISCYPDRLEYVDQILAFAQIKMQEFSNNPELHSPATTANLLSLLLAPITSYVSVLTLLAIPTFTPLLAMQPLPTRASIAQAIVSSILRNDTVIDSSEDVSGVLGLCNVLVHDQKDAPPPPGIAPGRRVHAVQDSPELAEEQGWLARMIHLFRSDDLSTQFELLQTARRFFAEGGVRIRYTFPPLATSAIKLARRYKEKEESEENDTRLSSLFKFVHQVITVLYNKVEASSICLQLFLLAAQVADECGLEELTYEFFVQAFVVYEESISESRSQLAAITGIINALQTSRVFGTDNYDTLITKAALHGSKLLKKPHQATAVLYASHMWWQTEVPGRETETKPLYRDGKRVLECLQKSLRIASSCIDEVMSVQLYVDALDQYVYYFEQQVEAVTPKYINSLVELITSNIDLIQGNETHVPSAAAPGLIDGVHTPDMIVKHFRNSLAYIQTRKEAGPGEAGEDETRPEWDSVEVTGALLKMGLAA